LKFTFLQIFIHFPGLCPQHNRALRRIERVRKVAIIKQQIESIYMCISEALLEKYKELQAGNHLQQLDVDC
jgi:hypothetical protein